MGSPSTCWNRWLLVACLASLGLPRCYGQSRPNDGPAKSVDRQSEPDVRKTQSASDPTSAANSQPSTKPQRTQPVAQEPVAVEAFVKEHLPQLSTLLNNLKKRTPSEYEKVSRELERSVQRLQSIRRRDEELYAVELEIWKVRHQLQLLAARSAIANAERKAAIGEKLNKFAEQHTKLELKRLQVLRRRAAKQLAQLDKQIEIRKETESELVAKAIRQWENRIKRQQAAARKAKNASKTKPIDKSE
ncbi:MAG TPA: hypothetical protein DDW52_15840 [Planctomycetaceae bacterium]|nr:hypothetical protein [Planctomycetaceae bacterium]